MEIGNKTIAQLAEELDQIPFFEGLRAEQLLDKVPFFDKVDRKLLPKIADRALILQFAEGHVVCRQGSYEQTFYVILSGEAVVTTKNPRGEEIVLDTMGRGAFFGEIGPISGQPRAATVAAKTRLLVLELGKDIFLEVLHRSPSIKDAVDRKYIERSLRTHLSQIKLFAQFSPQFIDELAAKVQLASFKKGDLIIREGDEGDSLYLVRSGFVKVSKGPLEAEKVLTYLRGGSYFGEMALLRDEKRTANVVAMTEVEAVRIGKTDFRELLAGRPEIRAELERTREARLKEDEAIQHDPRRAKAVGFVVRQGLAQARRILVVDLKKCLGCDNCVTACAALRGQARIERRGSQLGRFLVPTSCFHCENPECLLCPVGGIVRDKDGEIHHTEFCTGCGGCARRCPYGNILVIEAARNRSPGRLRRLFNKNHPDRNSDRPAPKIMAKCDLCGDFRAQACVYNCPTGAMSLVTPEQLIEAYR